MCVRCGTGRVAWCTDPYRHGESAEPVSPGDPPAVANPGTEELRHLAADLLELHEAGALAGIRAIVTERLREVRGEHGHRVDGRAYQAAMLAEEIDREAAR